MTVTYTADVANARLFAFSRLLFRWKGSIYKLMYKEVIVFCGLYASLSAIYRLALNEYQRRIFERIVLYFAEFINMIPLSFVLGFYVAIVVARWWNQFMCVPWPDRIMMYVTSLIEGSDDQTRMIRRTLMRYLTLGSLIVLQATSTRIKKRFPTMEHLIDAGVATREEAAQIEEVNTPHGKWWIPFVWCFNLLKEARRLGRIQDNFLLAKLMDELSEFRGCLGMLLCYDWISVPLVYTQVTTWAVYTFFLGCAFGRQFLDPAQKYPGHDIDLYVPIFTILQFFFYMGWLKVAEQLINPFGDDDDDFELSWVIDRNNQISLLVVDDFHAKFPVLTKDLYFGENPPDFLPYTKSSVKGITNPHMGSTADYTVSDEGMKILSPLEAIREGVALGSKMPSCAGTPQRQASPSASPKPIRRYLNQNLMSSLRSPDVQSRLSLHSTRDPEPFSLYRGPSFSRQQSVLTRATEKLGQWLINHGSRSDLNRPPQPYSQQVSCLPDDDRDSLRTCDSQHDLHPDQRSSSPGRLSPVAELFYSQSAPTDKGSGMDRYFSVNRGELESVKEEVASPRKNGELGALRQGCTPRVSLLGTERYGSPSRSSSRYSRSCSTKQDVNTPGQTEDKSDNCIELSDIREDPLAGSTDDATESKGVHWCKNLEQVHKVDMDVSGSKTPNVRESDNVQEVRSRETPESQDSPAASLTPLLDVDKQRKK